jgi:hypothetical protein
MTVSPFSKFANLVSRRWAVTGLMLSTAAYSTGMDEETCAHGAHRWFTAAAYWALAVATTSLEGNHRPSRLRANSAIALSAHSAARPLAQPSLSGIIIRTLISCAASATA